MSAPLKLTADELHALGRALDALTEIKVKYDVTVTPYRDASLGIGDSTVSVSWDDDRAEYVIDDRNGS